MAALASTAFAASGMFRLSLSGTVCARVRCGDRDEAGDSCFGWAFGLDYHFIVSSKVLWWKRKKKYKVESEFFHLGEKPRREFQCANFQRVIIMGVVGVEVAAVLSLPREGVRGNALSLLERERLDFGKDFPARRAWDPDGEESIYRCGVSTPRKPWCRPLIWGQGRGQGRMVCRDGRVDSWSLFYTITTGRMMFTCDNSCSLISGRRSCRTTPASSLGTWGKKGVAWRGGLQGGAGLTSPPCPAQLSSDKPSIPEPLAAEIEARHLGAVNFGIGMRGDGTDPQNAPHTDHWGSTWNPPPAARGNRR